MIHIINQLINENKIDEKDINFAKKISSFESIPPSFQREAKRIIDKYSDKKIDYGDIKYNYKKNANYCHPNKIKFAFLPDKDDRMKINSIPGRQLIDGNWIAPLNKYTLSIAQKIGCEIDEQIMMALSEKMSDIKINVPAGLTAFPFQIEGARQMKKFKGNVLLADEVGLGKTVTSLIYLYNHPELRPALVISPDNMKINWAREAEKWIPGIKTTIIFGKKSTTESPNDILTINYDVLYDHLDYLMEIDWKAIIIDECHMIKNIDAKRTKVALFIAKNIKHIIAISATPIKSRPKEFFNVLSLLLPSIFNNRKKYLNEYCDLENDPSGNGRSNMDKLHKLLVSTVMIRRKKIDVLKDLPPQIRSVIPIEIDNIDEYKKAEDDIIEYILDNFGYHRAKKAERFQALIKFTYLRQLAATGKIRQAIDWIENFIENEKLVVFCHHKRIVTIIYEHFKEISVKYDGSMNSKQKHEAEHLFQENDNIRLFVGNIESSGQSITLTSASSTLSLELPFTPGELDQTEGRVHRITQKADKVINYYLIATDTIEEHISELLDNKQVTLDSILDGEDTDSNDLLTTLIEKFKNKRR